MRNLTSLILLGLVGVIIAGDCNNPLLTTFNIAKLANPTAVTGLKFCKGLKTTGQACCSADTINGFQDKVKELTDKLATAMGKRDKYLAETRDKSIPDMKDKLKTLKDQAAKAVDKIKAKTADQKSQDTSKVTDAGATKLIDSLKTISGKMNDNLPTLKTDFKDFQKSRTSCVVQLVKLQASAWCLACDPDYATKGVKGANDITLGDATCKRLQNNCFKFVSGSASQSSIISAESISTIIDKLTASLTKIDGSDNSGKDDLKAALDSITKNADATTDKKSVQPPANCNSDSDCAWICSNLFKGAQIDQDATTIGGDTDAGLSTAGVSSGRLLEQEDESFVQNKLSKRRALQGNTFAPDEDEAGVAVAFQDDPAGVSQDSAAPNGSELMKSGLISMIVVMLTAFLV